MTLTSSQSSIVVVVLRIAGVICQAAAFVVLVNLLPAHEVGIFSVLYVFWGLVRMLGPIGLDHIILRDVAAARAAGDPSYAIGLSWRGCRAAGATGLILMAASALILGLINVLAGGELSAGEIAIVACADTV
jgi:O-antigen/teichoic acid export membrane protein